MPIPFMVMFLLWTLWLLSLVLMLLFAWPLLFPAVWRRLFFPHTIPMRTETPVPEPPPVEDASLPVDAPKESWEKFVNAELEASLREVFPAYTVAEEAPTRELLQELLAEEPMQQLRKRYMDLSQLVDIAERFQEWAEQRPAGEGLLLEAAKDVDYWFVGDVHASFGVLLQVWAFVRHRAKQCGRKACIILLGDIVDRGEEDFPCLGLVEDMLMSGGKDGVQLLCLRGNHDAALSQDARGNFASCVLPAETADALNSLRENGPAGAAESIGRAAIALARIAPCMGELTLPETAQENACILFAHGGVPHVDLQQEAVENPADFTPLSGKPLFDSLPESVRDKWAEDFTWIRLVDRLPHKKPNRGTHGNEMGTGDVNSYRRLHLRLTGRSVGFIVRGHDHEPAGYRLYSFDAEHNPARGTFVQKNCGVLTINTMEHVSGNPLFAGACPALACVRCGGKLELFPLPLKTEEL